MVQDILFSIDEYSSDGERVETGVFLHFGNTRVKVCDSVYEFPQVYRQVKELHKELKENYRE